MKRIKTYQKGGFSTQGYKKDSPDKGNPFNVIPSGRISMSNVPHPVYGYDNTGAQRMMYPGREYQFPGDFVYEVPVRQMGGTAGREVPTRQYMPPLSPLDPNFLFQVQNQPAQSYINQSPDRKSALKKAADIVRNPMTAARYKMQGQDIPDNLEIGDRSLYDNAMDVINPMTYLDAAGRTASLKNFRDSTQSLPDKLFRTALDVGMLSAPANEIYNELAPTHKLKLLQVESENISNQGIPFNQTFPEKAIIGKIDNNMNFSPESQYQGNNTYSQIPKERLQNVKFSKDPELQQEIQNRYNNWQQYRNDLNFHVKQYPMGSSPWLKSGESYTAPSGRVYTNDVNHSRSITDVISEEENFANFYRQNVGIDVEKLRNPSSTNPLSFTPALIANSFGNSQEPHQEPQQWQSNDQNIPIPADTAKTQQILSRPIKKQSKKVIQQAIQDSAKADSQKRIEWYHSHNDQTPVFDSSRSFDTIKQYGGDIPTKQYQDWRKDLPALDTNKVLMQNTAPMQSMDSYPHLKRFAEIHDSLNNEASKRVDNKTYDNEHTIRLGIGNFRGAAVDTHMIDDLYNSAKKQGIDPWQMMGVAGQETTMGAHGYYSPQQSQIMSDWHGADKILPEDYNLYLADNKVPGIGISKNRLGMTGYPLDKGASEQYLNKHPELVDRYRETMGKRLPQQGMSSFDLTAQELRDKGVSGYNPGDRDYPNKVNKRIEELKSDPAMKKYMKQKGYMKDGGWLQQYQVGGAYQDALHSLPPLNPTFIAQANTPQSYVQDRNKLKQQAQQIPWRDKIRSGLDYMSKVGHGASPTQDLIATAFDLESAPAQMAVDVSDPKQPLSDRVVKGLMLAAPFMKGRAAERIEEPQYGNWAPRGNESAPLHPGMEPILTEGRDPRTLTKNEKILQGYGIEPKDVSTSNTWTDQSILDKWNKAIQEEVKREKVRQSFRNSDNIFLTKVPKSFDGYPGKGEIFEQGYNDQVINTHNRPYETLFHPELGDLRKNHTPQMELNTKFPNNYTDFGPKTPYQKKYEGKGNFMPESLKVTERQQNKYGGRVMQTGGQLSPQQMNDFNALHTYAYQNAPNYQGDQYNHGNYGNGIIDAFNRANPGQAIAQGGIQKYQQDMLSNPQAIASNQGFSRADNKFGSKTMGQSYMRYQTQDNNGPVIDYGTDRNAAYNVAGSWKNQNAGWEGFGDPKSDVNYKAPQQWQSNDQGIPMTSTQRPQSANWHTNKNADYSIDSVRNSKYGGTMKKQKGGYTAPQVSNQYVMSPNDMYVPAHMHYHPAMRAQNGMMQMGGVLMYTSQNPNLSLMANGGPIQGFVQSIDDIGRQPYPQPNKGKGSTMNGMSWSQYGGETGYNHQFLPAQLEYAYLANGGYVDRYNTGGYAQDGGVVEPEEMKSGGIHIRPENKGKFNSLKKRTGKTTEELTHSSNPLTRKRAIFAQNASHWSHKELGGNINHPLQKFMLDGGPSPDKQIDLPANGSNINYTPNPNSYSVTSNGPYVGADLMDGSDITYHNPVNYDNGRQPHDWNTFAQGMDNLVGAGVAAGTAIGDIKRQRDLHSWQQGHGMTDVNFRSQQIPQGYEKGDYSPNTGTFRPNRQTPTAAGYFPPQMSQYGGYRNGGTYEADLAEHEIQNLLKKGFKVEYVK